MSSTRLYETNTSGLNSDRYVDRFDDSTLTKMQAQYWTAKQLLRKKLGKKEDEHLLASDAEFDAKVNLFKALQSTSEQMLVCIDDYQHYLGELTQTEVSLGQMLNTKSRDENGETSKALAAVGKVQSLSASYRQKIRSPLIRFMEELRVFSDRAILDCLSTVEAAEKARTEYRGSLLWMKKASIELDPEAENALEKFRKAQGIVRKNKEKLDSLKMDTLQKVDLLAASRCNLFAQLLETYQKCLYDFYEQSALAYAKIYDLVNSTKKYHFEILKDLSEPPGEQSPDEKMNGGNPGTSESLIDICASQTEGSVDDTAEAEIIDETSEVPLGISLEREESPLGEPESDFDTDITDRVPEPVSKVSIGPLPEKYKSTDTIPKLSPPPGWKMPAQAQDRTEFSKDLLELLAQNDSTNNVESFATKWSELFMSSQLDRNPLNSAAFTDMLETKPSGSNVSVTATKSNDALPNLPSQLLDFHDTKATKFPNPFEEPMFADWNKYLKELDTVGSANQKQC